MVWVQKILDRIIKGQQLRSIEVGNPSEKKGRPRRAVSAVVDGKLMETCYDGEAKTIYEVIRRACEKYPRQPAQVSRRYIETKKLKPTDKFPSKIFDDSSSETICYDQFHTNITNFGFGLRVLGLVAKVAATNSAENMTNEERTIVFFISVDLIFLLRQI